MARMLTCMTRWLAYYTHSCGSVEKSDKLRIMSCFSPGHKPLVILELVLHFSEVWKYGIV